MEYPSIVLQTRQKGPFLYDGGYEDIPDADLIILLKLAQKTAESLETELVRRHVWIDAKQSTVVDECVQKMRKTLSTVKTLQRLEDKAGLLMENAVNTVVNQPMNLDAKLYSVFLTDVLRIGSRELFVLCSASLGKQRIVLMSVEERLQLIQCIKANKTILECPILEKLATLHRVLYYNELFPSTTDGGSRRTSRKRIWEEGPGYTTQVSNSTDAACQTSENCQATFTADYSASEFLNLDEAGARIILDETKKSRHALTITLPAPHAHPPFMVIPHEICADIMRLHTS